MHIPSIRSTYLFGVFEPQERSQKIEWTLNQLQGLDFDSIAFRGMSGALIAPIIADTMRKTMILIRKPRTDEQYHSSYGIEGDCGTRRYVIVDDQISSGDTLRAIRAGIQEFAPEAKCVGVVLYYDKIFVYPGCEPVKRSYIGKVVSEVFGWDSSIKSNGISEGG